MAFDIILWILLFLLSMVSIYKYQKSLILFAILFILIYVIILWLIKEYNLNYAKYFFVFLPIFLGGISLYYFTGKKIIHANFFLGMHVALLVLVPFRALPYIKSWTRGEALFSFQNFGIHHWFFGSIIILLFFILSWLANFNFILSFNFIPSFMLKLREMFQKPEIVAFFLGFGLFWFTSQIPEILSSKATFPVSFIEEG